MESMVKSPRSIGQGLLPMPAAANERPLARNDKSLLRRTCCHKEGKCLQGCKDILVCLLKYLALLIQAIDLIK